MLSARDAAHLAPLDPTTVLRTLEDAIRTSAVAGRLSLVVTIGPFAAGSGPLWDAAVSVLVQEGYRVAFDAKYMQTTISWG